MKSSHIKFKKIKTQLQTTGKYTDLESEVTEFKDTENEFNVIGSNLLGKVEKISLRKTLKLNNTYSRDSNLRSSGRPPVGITSETP